MSQNDPAPVDSHQEISLAAAEEQNKQIMKAFGKLVERITPWLFEFGSWIFGGFIAFTLLVMAPLFTIGPVDPTIIVSTAAFAFALPLNVTGLFLLRLGKDLKQVGFEQEFAQAFFTVGEQVASPKTLESWRKRRTGRFLAYSLGILALSVLLTLTGMIAVLWYMAWWIGVMFFLMVIISLVIIIIALATSKPPESPEEKERKRRYREELTRQAKEQYQKNEERE